ncbi:MAG: OmpA family protein, partial [Deltaproteobacteria bacterium]|nr:OmpA family protein [Deltaproteobacteria bacterium]
TVGGIVENQAYLHLNGGIGLFDRVSVNLDIPIAFAQTGTDPASDGVGFQSPSSAQFGDLRVGARVRLWGEYTDPVQLGLGGYVWFPTGPSDEGSFVSDGTVRGMPQALVGGRYDWLLWSFATGPEIRDAQELGSTSQGSMWLWGAGLGALVDDAEQWQVGGELNVAVDMTGPSGRNTNAEGLVGAKWRFVDFMVTGLGFGTGLTSGIGTPDFRMVLGVAYTPKVGATHDRDGDNIADGDDACPAEAGPPNDDPAKHGCPDQDGDGIIDGKDACPDKPGVPSDDPAKHGCPADRDGDGIHDALDACPDEPGPPNDDPTRHGCPLKRPGDRDGDSIPDEVDACPGTPGVAHDDPAKHGCPPDRDGDGVVDVEDACPDVPGVPTADPATNGCPADRDGDGIVDSEDACPDTKGIRQDDPAKNGCPLVQITKGEVVISEQVQFDTDKATIKPVSDRLLEEVARVLNEHAELLRIEVQGHTDNTGGQGYNIALSKRRANSVKAALVKRGVTTGRLTTKGFGPTVPVGDNKTEAGRQKNRRVQFKILKRKP